jgi:hypothetical protein
MANQFKSGKEAGGYLFDVAIRKGKAAARDEWERIVSSLPKDQKQAFIDASIDIYEQKHIKENEGLGAAKVQRYREKAAKNMPVDYEKEFAKKPESKPVAKPTPKPAAKPATKPVPMEDEKGFRPYGGGTTTGNTVRKLIDVKADKPAPNSRPTIGTGAAGMLDLNALALKPSGKAPK